MQAAYTISFISSSGCALPDGSSLKGQGFAAVNKGEGERGRPKIFLSTDPELEGRSMLYLS